MAIRTKTYLTNGLYYELRIYVQPFFMSELPALQEAVLRELGTVGVQPSPEQLGLYNNRAGLHFYVTLKAAPEYALALAKAGWRPARN